MAIPNRLAILNTDGTTDTSFALTYGLNNGGRAVQVDKDGQIIVGGTFTQIDDDVRLYLAAVAQDGTISTNTANANNVVSALIGQTDGKTLVVGEFTAIGGVNRSHMCRIDSDLNVEEAYTPTFDGDVKALAQQEDGKTLVGGSFATVSGVARANIVRLYNNEAPTNLTVENVDLIQWLRGGASQEVQQVSFEEPAGTPIAGTITRISGGWQFVSTSSLTGSGTITARAYPTDSRSEGILEDTVAYDVNPLIQVSVDGVVLTSGVSILAYGSLQSGSTLSKTIVIKNIGLAVLTLTGGPTYAVLSGANLDQWDIPSQPSTPIAPGASVSFSLSFEPTTDGSKTATVTINSDSVTDPAFAVGLTGTGTPGPGGIDATWQPVVNGSVTGVSISPLENIWLGGSFTSINGLGRNRYARLNLNGVVQSQTGTGATGGDVTDFCQLPNGQCLIGGLFTTVNGVARARVARLNADGSLDSTFNITIPNGQVSGFILEATGNVIIIGTFNSVNGSGRNGIARILMSSPPQLDASFIPVAPGAIAGYAQTDGKLVIFNRDTLTFGLMRFNPDGSNDNSVSITGTGGNEVSCAIPTRDGKIIFGSNYATINGGSHPGVVRVSDNGTYDATFADVVTYAQSLQLQCDGKVIIGAGASGSLAATERLTRSLTTGVNDTTFVANATGLVYGLALQEDGKVLAVGNFVLSGVNKFASRLINDTNGATSSLSVASPTQVQWTRAGTAPETQVVMFAFSQDGGNTWTSLGQGVRTASGWERTGVSLPISGILRGQAYIQCGSRNGSVTIHEDQIPFGPLAVGDLALEYPVGTIIVDGGTLNFAGTLPGQFLDYTITLRNTGNASVTSIAASIETGDWTIISAPLATLAANQTTTVTVRFSPSAVGVRPAVRLSITSSVAGSKNPYIILLTGNGVAVPTATTTNSTSPGSGQRTFNGTFRANHDTANAYFQYKLASSGVWLDTSPPTTIAGFTNVNVNKTVSGLTVGQSYNWRAICYNAVNAGQSPAPPFTGSIGTFTAT